MCVCIVIKLLQLVYCRWRWQAFSLDPFTYACHPDKTMRIGGIRLDNILFRDVIQPQVKKENYNTDFKLSQKWRQH